MTSRFPQTPSPRRRRRATRRHACAARRWHGGAPHARAAARPQYVTAAMEISLLASHPVVVACGLACGAAADPSPGITTRFTSRAASASGATPVRRAILDAQSAKGAVKGRSLDPSGYDAGKKVLSRKRHVLVDTQGLLLNVDVHAADIPDRDGAETLLRQARRRFPFIERIVADGGYAGPNHRSRCDRQLIKGRGFRPCASFREQVVLPDQST